MSVRLVKNYYMSIINYLFIAVTFHISLTNLYFKLFLFSICRLYVTNLFHLLFIFQELLTNLYLKLFLFSLESFTYF